MTALINGSAILTLAILVLAFHLYRRKVAENREFQGKGEKARCLS